MQKLVIRILRKPSFGHHHSSRKAGVYDMYTHGPSLVIFALLHQPGQCECVPPARVRKHCFCLVLMYLDEECGGKIIHAPEPSSGSTMSFTEFSTSTIRFGHRLRSFMFRKAWCKDWTIGAAAGYACAISQSRIVRGMQCRI